MGETKSGNGKRKGVLAAIWESMTKTGGCCGSGGNCCGPAEPSTARGGAGQKPGARESTRTEPGR